jgi:hypothetical protein
MIAQIILTVLLSGIVLYAWREYRRSQAISALALGAAVAGLYLVWFPAHATALAAWAGVGRGVDLIIYVWVVLSLLLLLNLHLKLRAQHELITTLTRQIALMEQRVASAGESRPRSMDAASGERRIERKGVGSDTAAS